MDILSYPPADLIRNQNAFDYAGLELQTFMLLYSDENCADFEGARGLIAETTTTLPVTPDSMSCQEAVACALYPEGELCESFGGTMNNTVSIRTEKSASQAIFCANDDDTVGCTEIEPEVCMKSELFPNCWYHLVPAMRLFAEPDKYIAMAEPSPPETSPSHGFAQEEPDESSSSSLDKIMVFQFVAIVLLLTTELHLVH